MFTQEELNEIAAAHKAVYMAIRPCFGNADSDMDADQRATKSAATQIVAAKIIAGRNQVDANLKIPRR